MKQLIRFWVFGNFNMAFVAFLLTLETCLILGLELNYSLAILLFFATLFIYNLGYLPIITNLESPSRAQGTWFKVNRVYGSLSMLVSMLGMVYLLPVIRTETQLVLFISGGISMLYVVQEIQWGKKRITLRNIPYIKVFVVSAIWALTTVFPVVLESENAPSFEVLLWIFLERWSYFLAFTLLFDLRDRKTDNSSLKTVPMLIGVSGTKRLSFLLLAIGMTFSLISTSQNASKVLIITWYVIAFALVLRTRETNHPLYFTGILDGWLGMHAIFYAIALF